MTDVPAWLYAALRSAAQAIIPTFTGSLALLDRGMVVELIVGLAGSIIFGVVVGAIRWAETRTGDSLGAKLLRGLAGAVMLGLSKYQPVYAAASSQTVASSVTFVRAAGVPQRAVAEIGALPVLRE